MIDMNSEGDYSVIEQVAKNLRLIEPTDFSNMNRNMLKKFLTDMPACQGIIEIGVENNPDKNLTSTSVFLKNKKPNTYYFGVDILDRSHLDNAASNVYTIQSKSEQIDNVMRRIRDVYKGPIDFVFIDGWHSINQCKLEWDLYTQVLSKRGIVGFHDTNHHSGPKWLVESYIDRNEWNVDNYTSSDPMSDFGIGFAWRKR